MSLKIFNLEKIVISGSEHYSSMQLLKLVTPEQNISIFNIDLETIRDSLNFLPWVKKVVITRIIPNKLQITVDEHKVKGVVLFDKFYFYNMDYQIFLEAPIKKIGKYIIFSGISPKEYENSFKKFKNQIVQFENIVKKFNLSKMGKNYQLSEIHLTKFRGVELILKGGVGRIVINGEDLEKVFDRSYKILENIKKDKKIVDTIIFNEFTQSNKVLVTLKKGVQYE